MTGEMEKQWPGNSGHFTGLFNFCLLTGSGFGYTYVMLMVWLIKFLCEQRLTHG